MGFRFRRSVKIAPGIRMNFGLRGMSLSLGPRGASINVGNRGIYGNVGLPGTGLSYRGRLSLPPGKARSLEKTADPPLTPTIDMSVQINLAPDGSVTFMDEQGLDLPPKLVRSAFEQKSTHIRSWLEENAQEINRGYQEFVDIHIKTPPPVYRSRFATLPFNEPPPAAGTPIAFNQPLPRPPRFGIVRRLISRLPILGRVLQRRQQLTVATYGHAYRAWLTASEKYAGDEQRRVAESQKRLTEWHNLKTAFESRQMVAAADYERALASASLDIAAKTLEQLFAGLDWPRETNVQFEIAEDGQRIILDVDLPEVDDAPGRIATVADNGRRLHYKELSETARRRNYARHVHGVALRLAGEVFAALPTPETVVVSGYTQRADSTTGREVDHYLLSVRLTRARLKKIDFGALQEVDPISALECFEHRRIMSKTGIFTPIDPLTM